MKLKHLVIPLVLICLVIPLVCAAEENEDSWWDFDWLDIGENIAEAFYNFILNIINAPLQLLTDAVKTLLEEQVNTNVFKSVWRIITYTISMFYGLLFKVYSRNNNEIK